MKVKIPKLSPQDVLQAAKGELQIDVTEDMLKAMGIDEEARTAGILTKGVGDSNTDLIMQELKAVLAASSAPIQMPPEFTAAMETLTALKNEIVAIKGEMVALGEKAAQAILTAESVRDELGKKVEPGTVGQLTPDMSVFITQSAAAAKKATDVFAFDSVQGA